MSFDGTRLRELRVLRGLSAEALAELAGTDERTVRRAETGRATPRGSTRIRFAEALQCRPEDLLGEPKQGPPHRIIPFGVPDPPAGFVGRESSLDRLSAALDRGARGVLVCGMGGLGKSSVAFALALRRQAEYPDGQCCVDLGGASTPVSPGEAMRTVLATIRPRLEERSRDPEVAIEYRSALQGRRMLIVLDDAADACQVEPLIHGHACQFVVTSRRQFSLPGLDALELSRLERHVSRVLLESAGSPHSIAEQVADLCGDLPLALVLASAALAQPDRDPQEFVDQLSREREVLRTLDGVGSQSGIELALRKAVESLPDTERLDFAALGVFPATFDRRAAAAILDCDDASAREVLGRLRRVHLVEHDGGRGQAARYRLHDLVRAFARSCHKEADADRLRGRHAAHYLHAEREDTLRFVGLKPFHPQPIPVHLRRALPNIRAAVDWVLRTHAADPTSAENRRRLLETAVHPAVHALGASDERVRLQRAAVAAAEHEPGAPALADLLLRLALVEYHAVDTAACRTALTRAQSSALACHDQRAEGWALLLHSQFCGRMGEFEDAMELAERALTAAEHTGDVYLLSLALFEYGEHLLRVERIREAEQSFIRSVEASVACGDVEGEWRGLHGIAQAHVQSQDYVTADIAVRRALEASERSPDLPATYFPLTLGTWIAICLREYDRAEHLFERTLTLAIELDGRNTHGSTWIVGGAIGLASGNLELAEARARTALHVVRDYEYGDYVRPRALRVLAEVRLRSGDPAGAIELYEQSLEVFRRYDATDLACEIERILAEIRRSSE